MPSETGKQRKSRIALDYYRRPDAMTRARNGLALLAALGSIAWLAFPPSCHRAPDGSLRTLAIERLASPGPLASDHATWDSSCESCHTPFQAINHSAWSPALGHMPNSDTKCSACHTVGDHHANQFAVDIPACAECHRDHKGRDVSLISTDDAHCTACHGDIEKHRAGSGPFGLPSGNNVTRFARGEHPEFYWSRENHLEDPGQLRFNHALHLAPGLTLEKDGKPFTYGRIDQGIRLYARSKGDDNSQPVQLECASCHRLEPDARNAFEPVAFEHDCRACHLLNYDPNDPAMHAPHGLSITETISGLRAVYERQALEDNPAFLRQQARARVLPGKPERDDARLLREAIDTKVLTAARLLFNPESQRGCAECHAFKNPPAAPISLTALEAVEIVPINVPRVWSTKTSFDHDSHRALDCATCHAGAATSTTHTDIMLPDMNNCLQCHAPPASPLQVTAAGNACTECHKYHDDSNPKIRDLNGGTAAWQMSEFLRGRQNRRNP